MDPVDALRRFWVHVLLVVLVSAVGAALVFIGLSVQGSTYESRHVVRVTAVSEQLTTQSLETAVEWYAALGSVPAVQERAGLAMSPSVSASTIGSLTDVSASGGPGEVEIRGRSQDADEARDAATALGDSILAASSEPVYAFAGTILQELIGATEPEPAKPGSVTIAATAFLVFFVLLATVVGFSGGKTNWRMSRGAIRLAANTHRIAAYELAASPDKIGGETVSSAVVLSGYLRQGPLSLVSQGTDAGGVLCRAITGIGVPCRVVPSSIVATGKAGDEAPALVEIHGDDLAIRAEASRLGYPLVLVVTKGTREKRLHSLFEDINSLNVPIVAVLVAGRNGRTQPK